MWPTNTSGEMSAEWTTVAGAVSGGSAAARQGSEFSLLHIVLITFGGVVFVIGFLIVIVLLKSRKKLFAGNAPTRGDRFQRQSPIFVVGQGRGQGRGGDNPAFCRTDENNGGLPFPRNGAATASQLRLPTYEEVITGRVPTAVVRSNLRVHQHHHQQGQRQPPTAPAAAETSGGGVTVRSERPGRVTPPPRYAFDYPSCYWEEVPPPPYASVAGTAARALGRGPAQARESARGRGPERVPARRDHHESCGRGPASPYPGRAPLAVPTPTVLSPAQSPALPPRNHSQAPRSSSSAVPSTLPHPATVSASRPASAHVPMTATTSALPAGDSSSYPSCLPPRGSQQLMLTSAALPTAGSYSAALTRALPALWDNGARPLAASSPAVPRRHPPSADLAASSRPNLPVMPVLLSYRTLTPAHYRSRSDGAGGWQGPVLVGGATLGRMTATVPSAPIARFDIDL